MGEAAGPLSVSDSEDLAGGSLLIPSLETAEDLGDFGHLLCSIMGGKGAQQFWVCARVVSLPSFPSQMLGQRHYLKIRAGFVVQKALEMGGGGGGSFSGDAGMWRCGGKGMNGAGERMDGKSWPLPATES